MRLSTVLAGLAWSGCCGATGAAIALSAAGYGKSLPPPPKVAVPQPVELGLLVHCKDFESICAHRNWAEKVFGK